MASRRSRRRPAPSSDPRKPPQCDGARVVPTSLPPIRIPDHGDRYYGLRGALALTVDEGEVTAVGLTGGVREYSGYARGELHIRGTLLSADQRPASHTAYGRRNDATSPDLFIDTHDDPLPAGLWVTDEAEIIGRERLADTTDPQVVDLERLVEAAEASEAVPLRVTVRRVDGVIVRIEEESSGA